MKRIHSSLICSSPKRVYLIKQKETISHTWAIEAESWDDAMEKYHDDCHGNSVHGEAIQDSWEYHGDGATTKAGMVRVKPCVNYYEDSKMIWHKKCDSAFGDYTHLCFHNQGISEKDITIDNVYGVGDGYDAILNEDGVCRKCCRYESRGFVLTPMDEVV